MNDLNPTLCRLLSWLGVATTLTLIWAIPAHSFDFASELLVYQEDYQGEFTFPTTPEVNEIGAAGLSGNTGECILTGTSAHCEQGLGTLESVGVNVVTTFGAGAVGFRGYFEDLSVVDPDGAVIVSGFFGPPTMDGSLVWAGTRFVPISGGGFEGHFTLSEVDGAFGGGGSFLAIDIVLAVAVTTALVNGSPFVVDLLVDRDLGTVTATLDVPGFPTQTLGPTTLNYTTIADSVSGAAQWFLPQSSLNFDVDFKGLEIYRIPKTFVVNTLLDEVDLVPGDGFCSTANGFCSLRAAIQESNALAGPGEIIVPNGTYLLTLVGPEEDAAATGDLDILEGLIIRGADRNATIVDAGGIDRVFDVPAIAFEEAVYLGDLTITNGAAVTSGGFLGGAIQNYGRMTLQRCIVSNSEANLAGGIMNRGELTLEDCLVTGNEALDLGFTNSSGGGIASASTSAPAEFAVATIRNSAIVGNVAPIFGGIEFGNASSAHIENTTISGNSGQQVRIWRVDVVLEHVTISGNAGIGLSAGSDTGTRTLEITNSAIQGTPACNLTSVLTTRSGHNASNDTSCGFSNAGDIEGVALGLAPLAPVGASQAHVPYLGSPLIDAADLSVCLSDDQVHTPRPFDGDSDGSSDCDLGAIELPEPGLGVLLASGALWLSGCLNLRRRTNGIHRVG